MVVADTLTSPLIPGGSSRDRGTQRGCLRDRAVDQGRQAGCGACRERPFNAGLDFRGSRTGQGNGRHTWEAIERARAEEQLREANVRKDEFLAMLAHELRNPLAPSGRDSN